MKRLVFIGLLTATAAVAHEGVKNPAVMARMHGMKSIGGEMKTLGQMAKGATAFNAEVARAAAASIAGHAGEIEALFEAREDDPKSEALPGIWESFEVFAKEASALQSAATMASQTIASVNDLKGSLQAIGATCASCHKVYRKP